MSIRAARVPKYILSFDQDRNPSLFQVRVGLAGAISLTPHRRIESLSRKPYLLALDPSLMYARTARFLSANKRDVISQAQDLFPFEASSTMFGIGGITGQMANFFALTDDVRRSLPLPHNPTGVIVSKSNTDDLMSGLTNRLDLGEAADLRPDAPSMRHPAYAVFIRLLIVFCVVVGLSFLVLGRAESWKMAELQDELDQLENRVGDVVGQYEDLKMMQSHLLALNRFEDPVYTKRVESIFKFMGAMPPKALIERITMTDGTVRIVGLGNNAESWIRKTDLQILSLDVKDLPKTDLFDVTFTTGTK